MTRLHQPKQVLNLALTLAEKVLALQKMDGSCYEIDDAAAIAQMLKREVEYRDLDGGGADCG